ncbi:MAG: NADH dehydrogenase subunit [Candidatus Altiarchaeota archaeon]|nr:NADH dehydrogenase subunit [Candidatus Altiarchaeota archaeon]
MPRVEVPFGPYHPALGEPEYFRVVLDGEEIVNVDFDLGYNYREIEKKVLSFTWPKALILLGRICGICSSAHTQAFGIAFEKINQLTVSPKAKQIRSFGAELERIHSHLLWLGILGESSGFDTLFMKSWGAREHALNMLENISGKRIHYNYVRLGGVYRDLNKASLDFLKAELKEMTDKYKDTYELFMSNEFLEDRLKGVGLLSKTKAEKFGVVGPTARGSGLDMDVRRDNPYSAYEDLDFKVPTQNGGDSYARAVVRLEEIWESLHITTQILDELPRKKIEPAKPIYTSKEGEASQIVEAPRGENFHFLQSGIQTPKFFRARPPTFANMVAIPSMLKGGTMSDVPIVISSIDPCFACTDRVIVIDRSTKTTREVSI